MSATAKQIERKRRERFRIAKRIENEYARSLRSVVNQIDAIVTQITGDGEEPGYDNRIEQLLYRYSDILEPWARSVAATMYERIIDKDSAAWSKVSKEIGVGLRKELKSGPVAQYYRDFVDSQVELIKSLPIEAANRVKYIVTSGMTNGLRTDIIRKQVLETGKVTASRAQLIARTELSTASSNLTLARGLTVGLTHYYWRTASDNDVRQSHKSMANKVVRIDTAPEVEPGKRYHAGQFPNCRCWPDLIVDTTLLQTSL